MIRGVLIDIAGVLHIGDLAIAGAADAAARWREAALPIRQGDERRFKPFPTNVVADISEAVDWTLQERG